MFDHDPCEDEDDFFEDDWEDDPEDEEQFQYGRYPRQDISDQERSRRHERRAVF